MPETRPDDEAEKHKARSACHACQRPGAMKLKQRYYRRNRFTS